MQLGKTAILNILSHKEKDGRLTRGASTRQALMRAAERLIAQRGIENVSVKDITQAADQANASALQYHFGNLQGLFSDIRSTRGEQVRLKRAEKVQTLLSRSRSPSLREVCELMVEPSFDLAREDPGFRNAIKAFGHEIALAEGQAGEVHLKSDGAGAMQIVSMLRDQLPDLDEQVFVLRLDGALRFLAASMMAQAKRSEAFSGPRSDVFFNHLVDAIAGLFSAPVSIETKTCIASAANMTTRRTK